MQKTNEHHENSDKPSKKDWGFMSQEFEDLFNELFNEDGSFRVPSPFALNPPDE